MGRSAEDNPFGVGVIGAGPACQFAVEQLNLHDQFKVTGWHSENPDRAPTLPQECVVHTTPRELILSPETSIVYLVGSPADGLVAAALEARKHVVLPSVSSMGGPELRCLSELAAKADVMAVVHEARHWTEEAIRIRTLLEQHRLGTLRRMRLEVHDLSLPGEEFPQGVLRDLGWPWIDQLLTLTPESPQRVHLQKYRVTPDAPENGFLALIEFPQSSALVELQTRSLLSLRSGWLLEGDSGAYRDGRLYTRTADGEIIDEPVERPPSGGDRFFDALAAAMQNELARLSLPDLLRAARTAALMEKLEESCPG